MKVTLKKSIGGKLSIKRYNFFEYSNLHMLFYLFIGSDGYQADYIKLYTDTGAYTCYFTKFLDGDDSEMGHSCVSFW